MNLRKDHYRSFTRTLLYRLSSFDTLSVCVCVERSLLYIDARIGRTLLRQIRAQRAPLWLCNATVPRVVARLCFASRT